MNMTVNFPPIHATDSRGKSIANSTRVINVSFTCLNDQKNYFQRQQQAHKHKTYDVVSRKSSRGKHVLPPIIENWFCVFFVFCFFFFFFLFCFLSHPFNHLLSFFLLFLCLFCFVLFVLCCVCFFVFVFLFLFFFCFCFVCVVFVCFFSPLSRSQQNINNQTTSKAPQRYGWAALFDLVFRARIYGLGGPVHCRYCIFLRWMRWMWWDVLHLCDGLSFLHICCGFPHHRLISFLSCAIQICREWTKSQKSSRKRRDLARKRILMLQSALAVLTSSIVSAFSLRFLLTWRGNGREWGIECLTRLRVHAGDDIPLTHSITTWFHIISARNARRGQEVTPQCETCWVDAGRPSNTRIH